MALRPTHFSQTHVCIDANTGAKETQNLDKKDALSVNDRPFSPQELAELHVLSLAADRHCDDIVRLQAVHFDTCTGTETVPIAVQLDLAVGALDDFRNDHFDEFSAPAFRNAACIGILRALAFMHGNGFVHGDIKPANVLVMPDRTVRLTDFGISFSVVYSARGSPQVLNTDFYRPPEAYNFFDQAPHVVLQSEDTMLATTRPSIFPNSGAPARHIDLPKFVSESTVDRKVSLRTTPFVANLPRKRSQLSCTEKLDFGDIAEPAALAETSIDPLRNADVNLADNEPCLALQYATDIWAIGCLMIYIHGNKPSTPIERQVRSMRLRFPSLNTTMVSRDAQFEQREQLFFIFRSYGVHQDATSDWRTMFNVADFNRGYVESVRACLATPDGESVAWSTTETVDSLVQHYGLDPRKSQDIKACLQFDPRNRPSATALLARFTATAATKENAKVGTTSETTCCGDNAENINVAVQDDDGTESSAASDTESDGCKEPVAALKRSKTVRNFVNWAVAVDKEDVVTRKRKRARATDRKTPSTETTLVDQAGRDVGASSVPAATADTQPSVRAKVVHSDSTAVEILVRDYARMLRGAQGVSLADQDALQKYKKYKPLIETLCCRFELHPKVALLTVSMFLQVADNMVSKETFVQLDSLRCTTTLVACLLIAVNFIDSSRTSTVTASRIVHMFSPAIPLNTVNIAEAQRIVAKRLGGQFNIPTSAHFVDAAMRAAAPCDTTDIADPLVAQNIDICLRTTIVDAELVSASEALFVAIAVLSEHKQYKAKEVLCNVARRNGIPINDDLLTATTGRLAKYIIKNEKL